MREVSSSKKSAWTVVVMLMVYLALEIFNKSTMKLAAVAIMQDLQLDVADYGLIASSYSPLFALSGLCVGLFVVHRVPTKVLIATLVIIWSLAQLPAAFASSLGALMAANLILGAGQGPAVPLAFAICHSVFPSEQRNVPTAIVSFGLYAGGFIAAPLQTYVTWTYGWRSAFLFCTALGVIWLAVWAIAQRAVPSTVRIPGNSLSGRQLRTSLLSMLTDRTLVGCFALAFSCYWAASMMGAINPVFFQKGLSFSPSATGWTLAALGVAQAAISLAVSWVSQRLLKRGSSTNVARGGVSMTCMLVAAALITIGTSIDVPVMKVAVLGVAQGLALSPIILSPGIIGDVAPAIHRSALLLVVMSLATLGFTFSPYLAGRIIASAGSAAGVEAYNHAYFLATTPILCLGSLLAFLMLRPEVSRARLAALAEKLPSNDFTRTTMASEA